MDEQFEKWISQWEKAEKAFSEEDKDKPQPRTSFFTNSPSDADYQDQEVQDGQQADWYEIFHRTQRLDEDAAMVRGDKQGGDSGFSRLVRGDKQMTKGDITYNTNPTHFASVGKDQADDDDEGGEHLRVTQNFSAGEDLEKLADVHRRVQDLAVKAHDSDVHGKVSERNKIEQELKSLRRQVQELSQKIQSQVDKDVT